MSILLKKIGFVGTGNMGSAIISGLAEKAPHKNIIVYDTSRAKTEKLSARYEITTTESVKSLSEISDIIIIAVKPDIVESVLDQIKTIDDSKIVVSIAAGFSIKKIESILGSTKKIARVMPNTPALIGESMTAISANSSLDNESLRLVETIFESVGETTVVPEKLMDAVTGLSGSGPAYVFTFIQALADGGVKMGLDRETSLLLAVQTVIGSAKMVAETGEDPITLRGKVTSPGGTTIDAVHVLVKSGFSGIVMDAVETAANKSKALGEKS